MKLKIPFSFLFLLAITPVFGQNDSLKSLVGKFDAYALSSLQEKIFVHTDRTFYLTGESMWFSVFSVDGILHQPNGLSKVIYLELVSKDKTSVLKTKIAMTGGHGDGSLFLPASIASGNYVLIAYSHWMRNFSPEAYFHLPITIVNPFVKLDNARTTSLPELDAQFFAEGGNLVEGLKNTVAFRVVGKDGKGISFRGALLSAGNDTVARFSPLQFGLGQFSFTPEASQRYSVVITDAGNKKTTVAFPSPAPRGFVIRTADHGDYLTIEVNAKFEDPALMNQWVYLFAEAHQIRVVAQVQFLTNGAISFKIDKKDLREGVNHITLFDKNLHPVCERLFFKPLQKKLSLGITVSKEIFNTRQKVDLNFLAKSLSGSPLPGTVLSVAVARMDSLTQAGPASISEYLALTSELRGTVESPGFYLASGDTQSQAVDNLMLTHGWSRYRWEDILNKKTERKFIPELGSQLLSGVIYDRFGKPTGEVNTFLSIPGKDTRLYLARSNVKGIANFDVQNLIGERKVIVQAGTTTDSIYRFEPIDPFADTYGTTTFKEFELSTRLKNPLTQRSLSMQLQNVFEPHGTGHGERVDSIPFYGRADERYLLDDYTRFPTMEEVMREYVKGVMVRKRKDGFHFLTIDATNNSLFRSDPLILLDGVPVFNVDKIMAYDPRKIRKLDVVSRRYYLGHLSFDGVSSYTTYKGDLIDFTPDHATVLFVDGVQPSREFFSPKYETQVQQESRVPDPRYLLFWAPQLTTDQEGKTGVGFYTSDVPGTYRVVVHGLSIPGEAGSAFFDFKVVH
jgi:hypothetical protein